MASPAVASPSILSSLRVWTFTAAVTPVVLGAVLSYKSDGLFSVLLLLTTMAVVLAVNGAGNMVNTYFEIMREVSQRRPNRPQENHAIRRWDDHSDDAQKHQTRVVNSAAYLYGFGMACLWMAMWLSPANSFYLATLFFGGLSSSFIYTGGIRLKFYILGDLLAMFTFGPLSVLFSYTAQSGKFVPGPLFLALPLALSTEAIIHSKHIREMEKDRHAGVLSLAVLLGKQGSYFLFTLLLFLPYLIFVVFGTWYSFTLALPLLTMPYAFKLERRYREEGVHRQLSADAAMLNFVLSSLFVVGCCFATDIPFL